jgi:hypothetical protein
LVITVLRGILKASAELMDSLHVHRPKASCRLRRQNTRQNNLNILPCSTRFI